MTIARILRSVRHLRARHAFLTSPSAGLTRPSASSSSVMPAKAGIQLLSRVEESWTPAFAGVTERKSGFAAGPSGERRRKPSPPLVPVNLRRQLHQGALGAPLAVKIIEHARLPARRHLRVFSRRAAKIASSRIRCSSKGSSSAMGGKRRSNSRRCSASRCWR